MRCGLHAKCRMLVIGSERTPGAMTDAQLVWAPLQCYTHAVDKQRQYKREMLKQRRSVECVRCTRKRCVNMIKDVVKYGATGGFIRRMT
jgi:hypothetical protein